MKRSCLVGLILFAAVLLASAFALRRCLLPSSEVAPELLEQATAAVEQQAEAAEEGGAGLLDSLFIDSTPEAQQGLVEAQVPDARVEGLYLQVTRPIMAEMSHPRGLAVSDSSFFVTTYNEAQRIGTLYEVDRSTYGVRRSIQIEDAGKYRLGGIHYGDGHLWTCLSGDQADGSSLILGIDPASLEVHARFFFTASLRAVAQTAEGRLYGTDRNAEWFYEWSADGELIRQVLNASGVEYKDCDVIRESLVCAGKSDALGSVVDVIDPASLTLLARHKGNILNQEGRWVTGNAFAFDEGTFFFIPEANQLPLVWSYSLDDQSLREYVPSTLLRD